MWCFRFRLFCWPLFLWRIRQGLSNAIVALGIVYVPMLIRLVRSLTLVEKNKTYVEAAQSIGFSDLRIMFRHILPNCISTITVQITLDLAYAILDLAALSFLGLGVQPPTADWGAMLDEGRNFLLQNPLLALAPGGAIVVTVVALNILSDGIHQYLEPIQRKLPSFAKLEKGQAEAQRHSVLKDKDSRSKDNLLEISDLKSGYYDTTADCPCFGRGEPADRSREIHGLVGRSGCGKSMTAKSIMDC